MITSSTRPLRWADALDARTGEVQDAGMHAVSMKACERGRRPATLRSDTRGPPDPNDNIDGKLRRFIPGQATAGDDGGRIDVQNWWLSLALIADKLDIQQRHTAHPAVAASSRHLGVLP